jgi:phage terminase large subunit
MKLKRPIARAFLPLYRPARYKAVYGGRGSAKSHDRAAALIERCATVKTDAVCIREVQKSLAQSVKKLLELKIEELGLGDFFIVQHDLIKSVHGGVIIFMGMSNTTAESIKSLEGYDIALIEEAQSLSQRSLDLLRPTIRKPGSEIWAVWNPGKDTDPIDAFFHITMS